MSRRLLRALFGIRPGHLTGPPAPRHLAETPTEHTQVLEDLAHLRGDEDPTTTGRHARPRVTDAEWDGAIWGRPAPKDGAR